MAPAAPVAGVARPWVPNIVASAGPLVPAAAEGEASEFLVFLVLP